jgi:sigma-B regulation protein RsbU (phosphoserine phosphatase)
VLLRRASGTLEKLQPWGLPLGVLTTERYVEGVVHLGPGDLLVIYSDGLSEARPDLFRDHETLATQLGADDTASALAQKLVELATEAGGQLPDDLTVVVVRRSPQPAQVP